MYYQLQRDGMARHDLKDADFCCCVDGHPLGSTVAAVVETAARWWRTLQSLDNFSIPFILHIIRSHQKKKKKEKERKQTG